VTWLHWALLSALFAGLTAVLAKVGVAEVDADLATAIRTAVIVVLAWGIVLWRVKQPLSSITGRAWLFLVLSALATGASWLCYFRALKLQRAALVAPIDKLSVVVAMVLAVVFLGERLRLEHWIGGGLIVAGTLVIAWPWR
jgi:transporter family protein